MRDNITDWLDKALQLDGVAAAAICTLEGTVIAKAKDQNTDTAAVEHAIRCAADVFAVLRFQKIQTKWLRFEFEKAHFYCATDTNKHCLAVLVPKDNQLPGLAQLEQFIAEFASTAKV